MKREVKTIDEDELDHSGWIRKQLRCFDETVANLYQSAQFSNAGKLMKRIIYPDKAGFLTDPSLMDLRDCRQGFEAATKP